MRARQHHADKLAQGCERLGIPLSARQTECLLGHLALLAKWNRRLNLTGIHTMDDMVVRHLLDSLAILPFVRGRTLLDIGSGGGFPGLPLAVVHPSLKVTLLDGRGKRAEFLRHVCAELGLDNIGVVHRRVENYRPAEKFDTLAVRAFAPLGGTLEASAALHRPGCRLLAMKGRMPERELAQLDAAVRARASVEKLQVPFLAARRHLIIIEF